MAAGYRGLLAPWIGGAANNGAQKVGYRSLLAFWIGGAAIYGATPPTPPIVPSQPTFGGGGYSRHSFDDVTFDAVARAERRRKDDMELVLILGAMINEGLL